MFLFIPAIRIRVSARWRAFIRTSWGSLLIAQVRFRSRLGRFKLCAYFLQASTRSSICFCWCAIFDSNCFCCCVAVAWKSFRSLRRLLPSSRPYSRTRRSMSALSETHDHGGKLKGVVSGSCASGHPRHQNHLFGLLRPGPVAKTSLRNNLRKAI